MMLRYLELAHYFIARSSEQDGNVDFYPIGGPDDADGNVEIMEGLKSFWCDTLDDESRDYIIQLFHQPIHDTDTRTVESNLLKERESATEDFCA